MIDKKISIRYARALLGICEDKSLDEDKTLKTLIQLKSFFDENPIVREYLSAYVVSFEEKSKLINDLIDDDTVSSFLRYLAKKGRFNLFSDIVDLFEGLVYEKHNRVKAFVKSAIELDDSIKQKLKEQLFKKLDKEIEFSFEVDKDLIGGIIVQVKDVVYDGSLKTYLSNLEQRLQKLTV